MKNIPYGRQSINIADRVRFLGGLQSKWLTMGPALDKFEQDLCNATEATHAVAVSSGSAALHCAYAAIGLQAGDEVITTPLTFASTATTAMNLGAKIVFADVHPDTGNIDPHEVEALISSRTRAITVVDYAGHPADLRELMAIGQKYGIPIIEDAAHALGSRYNGCPIGSVADITTFSFFPTKNITTGEGGAVVTNSAEFARKARLFRSHGVVKDKKFLQNTAEGAWFQEVQSLGLNYRMPDLLARLGSSQMKRLNSFREKREYIFNFYKNRLGHDSAIRLPALRPGMAPMWHLYPVRVDPAIRREIFDSLLSAGVLVQVNYVPVNAHPLFKDLGFDADSTPNAKRYYEGEISLPIYVELKTRQLDFVCKQLLTLVK